MARSRCSRDTASMTTHAHLPAQRREGELDPHMIDPSKDPETLISFANMIDDRIGPIAGRDADTLALMLRRVATNITALRAALTAMVDRWEPDTDGADRRMWVEACLALGRDVD